VCIAGGGYLGLWTALELKRRDRSLDVVLVEAGVCGDGASGRNGGFQADAAAGLARAGDARSKVRLDIDSGAP